MSQQVSEYNPEYTNKVVLGTNVFWQLSLLIKPNNNGYYPSTGEGWHDGELIEDLGPYKAGTYVLLTNTGDKVSLSIYDEINEGWNLEYEFYIIIQKPIIVGPKRKAS